MIKEGDMYYVFSIGFGIIYYELKDLINWKFIGCVFKDELSWVKCILLSFDGYLWVFDVYEKNGKFYFYYLVFVFGKNILVIGVMINEIFDLLLFDYKWIDYGIVVELVFECDDWNVIDFVIIEDENGILWMSFGLFWGGFKLV